MDMNSRNLTLLTDLYELTMMQGYFERQENEVVVFDVFFRNNPCNSGYSIAAGLEQVIEYTSVMTMWIIFANWGFSQKTFCSI